MRIKGVRTQREDVEIEISDTDAINAYIEVICREYDLRKDYFIKGDQLVYEEEDYYGSHSSFSTKVVRTLNEKDMEGMSMLSAARQLRATIHNRMYGN